MSESFHDNSKKVPLKGFPWNVSEDKMKQIANLSIEKDQTRRFKISMEIMGQMLEEGPALIQGTDLERQNEWKRCMESVLDLWSASVILWKNEHYASATALAITTMEEVGKLCVERFRLFGVEKLDIESGDVKHSWRTRKTPYRDHLTKSVMAAMSGALIISRLDRVLGIEFVMEFLDNAENGRIEGIRQDGLYLDRKETNLHSPLETFSKDFAAHYVALAGEIFAEVLPIPEHWETTLAKVVEFEKLAGLPASN